VNGGAGILLTTSANAGWKRDAVVWAGVFGLAFVVRLIYLFQVEGLVYFDHLVGDAAAYDAWARRIAADWFGQSDAFYQAPLYPYFLASIYSIVGRDLWVVRLIQAAMGSAGCVLVGLACGRLMERRTAVVAGLMLCVYPPAIYFDGVIQKTSLASFLLATVLYLLAVGRSRPRVWVWFGVGVAAGLLSITRENALVLVPLFAVWLIRLRTLDCTNKKPGAVEEGATRGDVRADTKRRLAWVAAMMAGVAAVLTPVGVHNYRSGGSFKLTTFQAGPNFYMGNHENADGRYQPMIPGRETPEFEQVDATKLAERAVGRALSAQDVSDYWLGRALSYIRSDPIGWLKLMGVKWWLVWNRYEIPDTESYYIYRESSWLLNGLGWMFGFGVLCPLGLAGLAIRWRRGCEPGILFWVMMAMAVSVSAFYVFGRYRFPIVLCVVMFAASGVVEMVSLAIGGYWRRLRLPVAVMFLGAVWVNWPINPESELDAGQLGNLGATLAERGEIARAVPYFERAVTLYPGAPRLQQFLADSLSLTGRFGEAIEHYQAALSIEPGRANADFNLAVALEAVGRPDEALRHYRAALTVNPRDAAAATAIERLESGVRANGAGAGSRDRG